MRKIALLQVTHQVQHRQPLSVFNVAEPLGLQCLDAYLRSRGHKVVLLHPLMYSENALSPDKLIRMTIEFDPEIIGISVMTHNLQESTNVARKIRDQLPRVTIVAGGDHFSSIPTALRDADEFDFAIAGEGESRFAWLVENDTREWSAVADKAPRGIFGRSGCRVVEGGIEVEPIDLDILPHPTRYGSILGRSRVGPLMSPPPSAQSGMVSVYASRGCPFSCSYCNARQVWGVGVRFRTPQRIVDELRFISERYGVNTAFFVDLTLNANIKHLKALCLGLIKSDLKVSWYALLRPESDAGRSLVHAWLLELMREAGCTKVGFGAESLSTSTSQDLQRGVPGESLFQILRTCDEIGLLTKLFVMIGHPDEDEHYHNKLCESLEWFLPDELRIAFLTPFPGTNLWSLYKSFVVAKDTTDFTTFKPVLPSNHFNDTQLLSARRRILQRYYAAAAYYHHVEQKSQLHPKFRPAFEEFSRDLHRELYDVEARSTVE